MGNLNIGKDIMPIKIAVRGVEKNIVTLTRKRNKVTRYAAQSIQQFYDNQINIQYAKLAWLKRALD